MSGGGISMADQLILKESMLHDDSVKSIRVREDFLSDGRSYVSEYWTWELADDIEMFVHAPYSIET